MRVSILDSCSCRLAECEIYKRNSQNENSRKIENANSRAHAKASERRRKSNKSVVEYPLPSGGRREIGKKQSGARKRSGGAKIVSLLALAVCNFYVPRETQSKNKPKAWRTAGII
jgi:hypothetical protein